MSPERDPHRIAEILRVYEETQSCRKTSNRIGDISPNGVLAVVRREKAKGNEPSLQTEYKRTESSNSALVEFVSDTPIITKEDAIAYGKVDTSVWFVDHMEIGGHSVPMKLANYGADGRKQEKPVTKQSWRIKLYLKRIRPKAFHDAAEALFKRMEAAAPEWPRLADCAGRDAPHLLEIDLSDVHFGKLAWAPECGSDYDLRIAECVYRNAVNDLLSRVAGYSIGRIVMPIGNDFFHFDNQDSATSSGTRVDSDGRYAKVFDAGVEAGRWAVAQLAVVAPVELILIPGNHDRQASYHLAREIKAWFHKTDRVSVDASPSSRKYIRHGTCLIGYDHGDKIKPENLPGVMSTERAKDWGETTCHEWRRGHKHKPEVKMTTPVSSYSGCVVRTLRALCSTDAWHYEHGFIGEIPAAECHLYRDDEGYVGHFVSRARRAA